MVAPRIAADDSRDEPYPSTPIKGHLQKTANRKNWNQAVSCLLEFIFHSPICWIIRRVLGIPEYLPADELISRNARKPSSEPLPLWFLQTFKELPTVVLAEVFRHLDPQDIFRLQQADRRFWCFIRESRSRFPVVSVGKGLIELDGIDTVRVFQSYYDREHLSITHDQLAQSLQTVKFSILVIHHKGYFCSDSFHVPNLDCSILELRFLDFVTPETENELIDLFEKLITNSRIRIIDLIVRVERGKCEQIEDRLIGIVGKGRHLELGASKITVVSC